MSVDRKGSAKNLFQKMRPSPWNTQPSFWNTRPSFSGFKRKLKTRPRVWKPRPSVWKARPRFCVITRSILSQSATVASPLRYKSVTKVLEILATSWKRKTSNNAGKYQIIRGKKWENGPIFKVLKVWYMILRIKH